MLGKLAQVLTHFGRPGGAVQADHVDAERLERGERGPNFGPHQHGAGGLDRHLNKDGQLGAGVGDGLVAAVDGRLRLQQVLAGFNEEGVGAALNQAERLLGEGGLEVGVCGVAEAGQLGAGAHGAEYPTHTAIRRFVGFGNVAGDPGARLGQLGDAIVDAVIVQIGPVGAEGIGFNAVDAHIEIGAVNVGNHVGPRHVQDFVAALQTLVVLKGGSELLQHGAHRTIGNHHAAGERVEQCLGSRRSEHPSILRAVERGFPGFATWISTKSRYRWIVQLALSISLSYVAVSAPRSPAGVRCGHDRPI